MYVFNAINSILNHQLISYNNIDTDQFFEFYSRE